MRYSADHKQETRAKITAGTGRAFRKHGYAGVGVDGLAKEAGVTSGAFYTHFGSKDEAFLSAVTIGMEELLAGIRRFKQERGDAWFDAFTDWYLGKDHRKDLACGCALVTLSPEVVRAEKPVRTAYGKVLNAIVDEIADGLKSGTLAERKDHARVTLSLLAGAVTLSRSVGDDTAGDAVARSARDALKIIIGT